MSRVKDYYASDFLEKQLKYYASLPEKQRRHFLGMEYERLGKGSQRYLSRVFKYDRKTITTCLNIDKKRILKHPSLPKFSYTILP